MVGEVCEWFGVPWRDVEEVARGYIRQWISDEDEVDDLAQDCLMKVWLKGSSFAGRSSWTSWLYRLARNEFLSRTRRNGRRMPIAEDVLESPEDRMLATMMLERALAQLPEREREVVALAHGLGLTSAEIGERLGAADSTIRCWKMDARSRLAPLRAEIWAHA